MHLQCTSLSKDKGYWKNDEDNDYELTKMMEELKTKNFKLKVYNRLFWCAIVMIICLCFVLVGFIMY